MKEKQKCSVVSVRGSVEPELLSWQRGLVAGAGGVRIGGKSFGYHEKFQCVRVVSKLSARFCLQENGMSTNLCSILLGHTKFAAGW